MEQPRIILLALAGGLICLWLGVALMRRKPAAIAGTVGELQYGYLLRSIALVVAVSIPALLIVIALTVPVRDLTNPLAVSGAFACMSLLGGLLLVETSRVRLVVTEEALIAYSPWRGRREVRWAEVQKVAYSALNRWFVITGPGGQVIRASRSLVGLPALLAAFKHKVPADRTTEVQPFLANVP
jgi:hypothetical protein